MSVVYTPNPEFPWIEACPDCGGQKHKGYRCEECIGARAGTLSPERMARWIEGKIEMRFRATALWRPHKKKRKA